MPKHIKGIAGRTPPVLSDDHGPIDSWLAELVPAIQPLATALDKAICKGLAEATFTVKRARAYYGLRDQGCVIELAAYFRSANVLFYGGADFDPPPPLGETDRTRYVKLTSVDEAARPDLHDWIRQARQVPGWT